MPGRVFKVIALPPALAAPAAAQAAARRVCADPVFDRDSQTGIGGDRPARRATLLDRIARHEGRPRAGASRAAVGAARRGEKGGALK